MGRVYIRTSYSVLCYFSAQAVVLRSLILSRLSMLLYLWYLLVYPLLLLRVRRIMGTVYIRAHIFVPVVSLSEVILVCKLHPRVSIVSTLLLHPPT